MHGGAEESTRTARQREILEYWRLIEMFSPQKVPKADPQNRNAPIISWRPGRPLPWDVLPPAGGSRTKPKVWQHNVYLGVYRLEAIYEHLHRVFPASEDAYDVGPAGRSACAALVVDQSGRVIVGSPMLSSASWAVGRAANTTSRHPAWFDGFEKAKQEFSVEVTEFLADVAHANQLTEHPRIDAGLLVALRKISHAAAGIVGVEGLEEVDIIIVSNRVPKERAADLPEFDFLNSFHLDELGSVSTSHFGAGLDSYLTPDSELTSIARIDVRENSSTVIEGTGIDRMPRGRWLSNPNHPLATSQQFAVNEALDSLGRSSGLMGVNGPPGTGKTTMLRDLLADNVVRRATVLAQMNTPNEAFTGHRHTWKSGAFVRSVRQLRDDIIGYEMVVASSNNAAVANVSDELPRRDQIHETWDAADYFADLATSIAAHKRKGDAADHEAWGLIAARLGNKSNRNDFKSAAWFGVDPGVPGLQDRLKAWEADASTRPSWRDACAQFRSAERRVERLQDAAREADRRLRRRRLIEHELRAAEQVLVQVADTIAMIDLQAAEVNGERPRAVGLVSMLSEQRSRHMEARPNWMESVLSFGGSTRTWRRDLAPIDAALADAETRARTLDERTAALAAQHTDAVEHRNALHTGTSRLRDERTSLDRALDSDSIKYGSCYPGAVWLSDPRQMELHSAWQDPELNTARADLFLAALRVHHAFLANATDVRKSLHAAFDVMSGDAPNDLDPAVRRSAWQMFFLAVPLVSTTFASAGRMLGKTGPEAVGWLLIDEAGQATPQEAVGAIWRSTRVLAVGDPMQLTPVVTIPARAQHDLAARFGIDTTWIPSYTSVQRLADRVGRYGTTLRNGDEPTWVSSPLRVHRRCDSPMFDVSNAIAYENMMIDGVHRSAAAIASFAPIEPSSWLDTPSPVPGNHLQQAEVARLRTHIDSLVGHGLTGEDIIAISPFRAVARELERVAEDYPGMRGGTIHTAQGREAPVVYLVLGGDPQKPGAKSWASSTPNLVNVAASRAQRRLYVIGDHDHWHRLPSFSELATMLSSEPSTLLGR